MKITEKYLAGEMVEIVTRGGSVARQRRIARVTKTLVILDNGRRYRKKGGTDVSFKWSYDSIFFIRPVPSPEAFVDCAKCGERQHGVDIKRWTQARTSDGKRVCNSCTRNFGWDHAERRQHNDQ
jgi:hypothetical protein